MRNMLCELIFCITEVANVITDSPLKTLILLMSIDILSTFIKVSLTNEFDIRHLTINIARKISIFAIIILVIKIESSIELKYFNLSMFTIKYYILQEKNSILNNWEAIDYPFSQILGYILAILIEILIKKN